jgi:hypothetical protein
MNPMMPPTPNRIMDENNADRCGLGFAGPRRELSKLNRTTRLIGSAARPPPNCISQVSEI